MQVKKVEGTPLPAKGTPETTVQQEVQEKHKTLQRKAQAPSKKTASKPVQKTSAKKASKKPAVRKKASTPADAILQSKAVDPDIDFLIKIPLAHVEKCSIQLDIINEDEFTPYSDEFFSSFTSFKLDDGSLFSRYETNVPELAIKYATDNFLSFKPNERNLYVHDTINGKTVVSKYVKVRPKLTLI